MTAEIDPKQPHTTAPQVPFAGAHALVIGGGRNIGRAIVLELARRGSDVAVADLDEEGARETAEMVRALGRRSLALRCDVTSDESVAQTADAAEAALGPVNVVVNNAGILSGGNPEDIPVAAWQKMMDVNFFGMVRSNAVFLPRMLERGRGHIAFTASFAGLYPFATSRIHYSASKAAIIAMAQNLALYCMPKGLRVTCLCPGPVMTTSTHGMTHYSENYTMRMPGAHLTLMSQEQCARVLADAMEAGRILVPTHDEAWQTLRELAASPDAFIARKNAEFESGNSGKPQVPAEFLDAARGGQ